MALDLHDQSALLDALLVGIKRPISFLVGSPMSWDDGGGVPGVGGMIDIARIFVTERLPRRVEAFDATVGTDRTGASYQAALRWIHGSLTQAGVDEVIRRGVLQARLDGRDVQFRGDGIPADWYIPKGTLALGKVLASGDDRFGGPVLTTNFDPLVSLAIRAAGGVRRLRVIDSDGGLPRAIETDPGEVDVVHLHGYWKGAATLHTPAQLTSERPRLAASLRNLLTRCAVVVIGYGGWDDIFTKALGDAVQDVDGDVTVLWCFREPDGLEIERKYAHVLNRVRNSITSGKFHLYGGVDCHGFLKDLQEAALASTSTSGAQTDLPGWTRVSREMLAGLPALARDDAVRFFDGAPPTWKHAGSAEIPRRWAVQAAMTSLRGVSAEESSLCLIRGAAGEGKSTVLMQCAIDAARSGDWEVLYRTTSSLAISAEVLATLDPFKQWLVVIDEAESAVESIFACIKHLREIDHANVDFLIAARDADWIAARGDRLPWRQYCYRLADVVLRGIDDEKDASAIVQAWSAYGTAGLRKLGSLLDNAQRAQRLRDVGRSIAAGVRTDGSFFGALLEVRFSEPALREHVRVAMDRLQRLEVEGGHGSLADALIYVAACHSAGIDGLDTSVLADVLGAPHAWVRTRVLARLGEEVAVMASGDAAFTRHSRVADAIVTEAELSLGFDLGEVWSRLIAQVLATSKEHRVRHETHSRVLHAAAGLQKSLPDALPRPRRAEIALAAGRASIDAMPDRLDVLVDYAKALRMAERHSLAITHLQSAFARARSAIDYVTNIRGYVHEWSVCVGAGARTEESAATNAWLAAYALSDGLEGAPVSSRDLMKSCGALGLSFARLNDLQVNMVFSRARRAAAWLGGMSYPDARAREQFEFDAVQAERAGAVAPRSPGEAYGWINDALTASSKSVRSEWVVPLPQLGKVEFRCLQEAISNDFRTLHH
jgi:hypothetical protein